MSDTNRLIPKYNLHFQGTFLSHNISSDSLLFETLIPKFGFQYLRKCPFLTPRKLGAFIFKLHSVLFRDKISLISLSQGVLKDLNMCEWKIKNFERYHTTLAFSGNCMCLQSPFVYIDCDCCWVCPWWFHTCLHGRCFWILSGNSLCCCCFSVAQSCLTLCDPMDCSTPGFPALHYLPEFAQVNAHWVGDTIYLILCHPHLLLPSIFSSNRINPRGNQHWIFSGRTDGWSWSSSTLATWGEEPTHWKRPWCWEIVCVDPLISPLFQSKSVCSLTLTFEWQALGKMLVLLV